MSTFLKAAGILLIMSGIGLFLLTTSSAAEVGSQPVRNQYEAFGRNLGVSIGWSSISCISLVLFVSGVFTWWAGHNAEKPGQTRSRVRAMPPNPTPAAEREVAPIRKPEKRGPPTDPQYGARPIIVQGGRQSVKTIIMGWTLFLYVIYAAAHLHSWIGCDNDSALLTLFPIRQVYFVRAVEEKWVVSNSMIRRLSLAIDAGGDETAIMHLVKHGDCKLLSDLVNGDAENIDIWDTLEIPDTPIHTPPAAIPITATVNLNIRTGPDTRYESVGKLRKDERATAFGRDSTGEWVQLDRGWVSAQYINASQNIMLLSVTSS